MILKLLPAIVLLPSFLHARPFENMSSDGKTPDGWEGNPACWRVADGILTGEIKEGTTLDRNEWFFMNQETGDFELTVEYRITGGPTANSGIQIRSRRDAKGQASGLQCDLDDGKEWLGRIYDEHGRALVMERGTRVSIAPDGRRWADPFADPKSFTKIAKKDDWNTYRIKATGSHVQVWINGVFFGALDDHESKAAEYSGKIAFQLHAGAGPAKVEFRNFNLLDKGKTDPPAGAKTVAEDKPDDVFHPSSADGKPLNLGFEKGNLDGWTAEGDAWESQPIKGDTVSPRKPGQASRHAGQYWIGGYEPKLTDAGTGKLTSVPFEVTHPWASFLVGGGGEVASVRVEIVDAETGKIFHTAAGRFEEDMHREVVDMRPMKGKKVFLRLIDRAKGGWDHLNFDDFAFHNEPPAKAVAEGSRQTQSPVLWHLQPNPAKPTAIQNPEAQKTVATMMLTSGFQAELIAAEPEVRQPIAFTIDEKGRLWILEGYSYPNKQPEGQGKDRIIVLSDQDGDGVFETRRVFAEGINLGSGIEVGFGGVFVGAAPELLFFPASTRDDQVAAGPPKVLLDGWGYQDTHETLNSFSWGPDGWLYGCHGVFTTSYVGKPGTAKEGRVPLHAGVWRYHPVKGEFEVFAHGGSNQWGLDYNEAGDLFMTHCRSFFGGGGTTYVIRNGHYWNQANAGYAPFISNSGPDFAPDLKNYLPAAALYDSGEGGAGKPGTTAIYGGHSHVGTMIYQGTNWPEIYRGHLFTHNLHGHQMNHQENVRSGSGYETMHAGADLLHAPDPRYMAVDLQSGPDGAVYTIDWFDQQHCHTPIEEKWDRSNGRVYRVSWAATYKPVKVDLSGESDEALAKLQNHADEWYRRNARRLLMERAATRPLDERAVPVLRDLAGNAGMEPSLRGLWTLAQCNLLTKREITLAARNDNAPTRAWAVRLATEKGAKDLLDPAILLKLAKEDPAPAVRLALASGLPSLPNDQCWEIVTALAAHVEDDKDRFLPKLIWTGFAPVAKTDWPRALALAATTPLHELADSIRWYAAQDAAGREALASAAAGQSAIKAGRAVRIAAFALRDEATLTPPASAEAAMKALGENPEPAVLAAANELAATFGDKDVLGRMRAVLADANAPLGERKSAFALLKRTGDKEALGVFATLLDNAAFRSAVIPLLGRSDDPAVATALLERYANLSVNDRNAALAALTSRAPLALTLVKAMAAGTFDKKQLTAVHIRQMRNLGSAELNTLLEKTWGKFNPSSEASKATIAKFKKLYNEAPLWAYDAGKGREVFTRVCGACHAYGQGEARVGPNLGGTWRNGVDYFLENIADPNAVIGDDFQLTIITKKDDTVYAGIVEKETDTAVVLRTLTESVSIPKADNNIKSREKLQQSLMPPGLLESMSEREALELLKFLSTQQ